jgi:heme-degrading monooxygenase HmoA
MFAVIFEVQPKTQQFESYLGIAKILRPELEQIDGFVENIRYRSLTREGSILSVSTWRDEQALVRWRNHTQHHGAQERGRAEIFSDYHLRVGELMEGTENGRGAIVTLIDGKRPPEWVKNTKPEDVAKWLGLPSKPEGLGGWDVFEAVLTPGDIILLMSFDSKPPLQTGTRLRRVCVVRDYGMYDRREAPQYYPDVTNRS